MKYHDFPFDQKIISYRAQKLFLTFMCEDIGFGMVTNM